MPSEKENVLGFNQCVKSDKMVYIIYADIDSLIKKKQMDLQIIQKIFQQQKLDSIFLKDIKCQQYGDLVAQKKIWGLDHREEKHLLYCGKII